MTMTKGGSSFGTNPSARLPKLETVILEMKNPDSLIFVTFKSFSRIKNYEDQQLLHNQDKN